MLYSGDACSVGVTHGAMVIVSLAGARGPGLAVSGYDPSFGFGVEVKGGMGFPRAVHPVEERVGALESDDADIAWVVLGEVSEGAVSTYWELSFADGSVMSKFLAFDALGGGGLD